MKGHCCSRILADRGSSPRKNHPMTDRSSDATLPTDRRTAPRSVFPSKVVVSWGRGGAAPELLRAIDLGSGGMRLSGERAVEVGHRGRLERLLPEQTAIGLDFVVVWVLDRGPAGRDFGVRFLDGIAGRQAPAASAGR
jgi:hypothetical protein